MVAAFTRAYIQGMHSAGMVAPDIRIVLNIRLVNIYFGAVQSQQGRPRILNYIRV